jgi:regulator of sigma E protease
MMSSISDLLHAASSSIIGALIVLGVVIVLHELGHFLVAKFFKIKVETFSVGFGPRLFGVRYGETDYRISAFPLGGYVKMAGENPADNLTGDPREFLSKPKWQRFLVAAAGPTMNVILAVVLLTGVFMYGSEIPAYWKEPAVIAAVNPGSAADMAGIRPGDRITSLDGKANPEWQEVESRVVANPGIPMKLTLDRAGQPMQISLTPTKEVQDGPAGPTEVGDAGFCPNIPVIVRRVWTRRSHPATLERYPGEEAGLQAGDEITAVKGIQLSSTCRSIQEVIKSTPEESFPLTIARNGQAIAVNVTTTKDSQGQRRIGIDIPPPSVVVKHGFAESLSDSIALNREQAGLMFDVIGKLFKRQASLNQLAGPIGIIRVSGQAYEVGMGAVIRLMAFISLNLGVLNTLPIPILDGGVMMLLLIESLMRRELSLRMKERIVQVGFVFLLVLTVFVLYNDVMKLLPPGQHAP